MEIKREFIFMHTSFRAASTAMDIVDASMAATALCVT